MITIIHGDSRVELPRLATLTDRARTVVLTDPPWPGCKNIDIHGTDNAVALWHRVASAIPLVADRLILHIGAPTDPRGLIDAVPLELAYFGPLWLRYVPPMYRGHQLVSSDLAFAFGMRLEHLGPGRKVFPAECNAADRSTRHERMKLGHPCPRNLEHVRWMLRHYCAQADLVIDPFCGSGTTLVACAELGIDAIGIDSDERWVAEAGERVAKAERQGRLFAGGT